MEQKDFNHLLHAPFEQLFSIQSEEDGGDEEDESEVDEEDGGGEEDEGDEDEGDRDGVDEDEEVKRLKR